MVEMSDKEHKNLQARLKALKESEEKLRCVFDSSPVAITCTDLEGKIIDCNQATVDLHRYSSKEELKGKSAFDLIARKDHEKALQNLKRTLEEGFVKSVEYTFLTKDGREFPAELSAGVVKDAQGNPTSFMAITMDITRRKQAERELRIKDDSIQSSISAIAIADPEGKLLYVNDSFLKMWGIYNESEVLGRFAAEFWKDKEKALEIFRILKKKGSWNGRVEAKKKDGSILDVHVAASVATSEEGKPLALTASFMNQEVWEILVLNRPNLF